MASCSQYAAAFGYQLFIVPVSACGVDLSAVGGGVQAGGFIDPTSPIASNIKIEAGADPSSLLAGDPGVNIVYDNDTVTTETVIRLYGLTNASLETDTGSETVTTYDTESKGFDQNVAVSKSWSLSLEGVSQFTDAGYKALRLLEQNAVAGSLKVKIGRLGPTGTSEAIYGYATLTGFSESIDAGSIVQWTVQADGFGPYSIDLDNSGTINNVGPLASLSVSNVGANLANGSFAAQPLSGGTATADVTVSSNAVSAVAVNAKGGEVYAIAQVLNLVTPLAGAPNPSAGAVTTLSIANPGVNQVDGVFPLTSFSGQGAGATNLNLEATVAGGIVTGVTVQDGGSGYSVGEVLVSLDLGSAPNPNEGEILTLTVTNDGADYANGIYSGVPLTGGSGTSAIGTVEVDGFVVRSVVITDGGSGYIAGETLSADDADLGNSGIGIGLVITVDTVDNNSGVPGFVPASFSVDAVQADLLTATQPQFAVVTIEGND